MTGRRPGASAKVIATDAAADAAPIDWGEVGRLFAAERWYWVGTTGDDGRPHLRPVLASTVAYAFGTDDNLGERSTRFRLDT